ncbi:hypothetical protein OBBRIDRAFT_806459 [Obba rivulosa]|uniref:Uncharacterized protein n=1 Tax=Obba rivulosa TaxID=1052685 RepID=A0A8E2DLG9_9APHY|nr:hypothetical protein OBBRIDRAFT_806459 [Obba rivulosa]
MRPEIYLWHLALHLHLCLVRCLALSLARKFSQMLRVTLMSSRHWLASSPLALLQASISQTHANLENNQDLPPELETFKCEAKRLTDANTENSGRSRAWYEEERRGDMVRERGWYGTGRGW